MNSYELECAFELAFTPTHHAENSMKCPGIGTLARSTGAKAD
jgi:hypothetical protein